MADVAVYQHLEAAKVLDTVQRLQRRIGARFPERGLARVAAQLAAATEETAATTSSSASRLKRVKIITRILVVVIIGLTLVALSLALDDAATEGPQRSFEWVPLIESTVNDLVFAAIAVAFLIALPARLERGTLLKQLHRLRSLAHVVDMHQLTKDPERFRSDFSVTPESVDPGLSRSAMEHYLDYCSELLSLIGKTAALCAESSQDAVVLDTISTIETLTTGMSRKIWQKISLLPD